MKYDSSINMGVTVDLVDFSILRYILSTVSLKKFMSSQLAVVDGYAQHNHTAHVYPAAH